MTPLPFSRAASVHPGATSAPSNSIPHSLPPAISGAEFLEVIAGVAADQPDSLFDSLENSLYQSLFRVARIDPNSRQRLREAVDDRHGESIGKCIRWLVEALADAEVETEQVSAPVDAEWEEFQRRYPRWEGDEAEIYAAFCAARREYGAPKIFAGLDRWLASVQWRDDDGKYIPKPINWLKGEKWRAFVPRSRQGPIVTDRQREFLDEQARREREAVKRQRQAQVEQSPAMEASPDGCPTTAVIPANETRTNYELAAEQIEQLRAEGKPAPAFLLSEVQRGAELEESLAAEDLRRQAHLQGRKPSYEEIREARRQARARIRKGPIGRILSTIGIGHESKD